MEKYKQKIQIENGKWKWNNIYYINHQVSKNNAVVECCLNTNLGKVQMKNEKWKMKNEKWKMKNEKWKMENENENENEIIYIILTPSFQEQCGCWILSKY